MRLTVFAVLISTMQLWAGLSLGQSVNLKMGEASVREVFKELKKQTGTYFMYNEADIHPEQTVFIRAEESSLEEVLTDVCEQALLEYELVEDYVLIKKRAEVIESSVEVEIPKIKYSGRVVDQDGEPIPFATILITGTTLGTASDTKGEFVLEVEEGDYTTMIVSSVGYVSQEIKINGQTNFNFVLYTDVADLGEVNVYVTGLTKISKERATGSFSVVSGDVLEASPNEEIISALEGNITGIQENKETGELTIRGRATINSEDAPLIVVDGFPIESGFASINPNDVDHITVLKDAAATSIWGARAGNGVIVITTKNGKGTGKINVEFNSYLKVGEAFDLDYNLPRASVETQLNYEKYIIENNYASFQTPDELVEGRLVLSKGMQAYWDYSRGEITQLDLNNRIEQLKQVNYKDDVNKYLLQKPVVHQHNLNISGNSDKSSYNLSVLYNNVQGYFKGSTNDKVLINFRNNYQIKEWLGFRFGISTGITKNDNSGASLFEIRNMSPYENLVNDDNTYAQVDYGVNYSLINPLARSANGMPYTNWGYNPLQESLNRDFITRGVNTRIQSAFDFKILDGLYYRPSFQFETILNNRDNYYGEDTYYARDMVNNNVDYDYETNTVGTQYVPKGGILNSNYSETKSYNLRNQLNFDRKLGEDHEINLLAAVEHTWSEFSSSSSRLYGYNPETNIHVDPPYGYGSAEFSWSSFIDGRPGQRISSGHSLGDSQTRFFSMFANAAYTYQRKYTITASYRTDASNMIVEDPKFRYSPFWSIGGSWNMIHEAFMQEVDFVDRLILRSTYGVSGNTIKTASTVPVIGVSQYPSMRSGETYAVVADRGNPTLRWEKINQFNVALDFSLYKHKLYGTVEVYNKHSNDLLANVSISPTYGATNQQFNAAEVSNKGLEISLNSNNRFGDFVWNTGFNYSYNTNVVSSLNISHIAPASIVSSQFIEGESMYPTYSYVYGGMNEDNIPTIIGENEITYTMNEYIGSGGESGKEVLRNMGTRIAPTVIGWNNTLRYKGFTFRALLTAKFGHVYRRSTFNYNLDSRLKTVYHEDLDGLMNGEANEMGLPVIPEGYAPNTIRWAMVTPYMNSLVDDAAHIRIKELYLGYQLPKNLISNIGIDNLTVYAHARDLGTLWTANEHGIDPDYIKGYGLKPGISYTFGLKLGF